jgi:TadE-like protein
VRAVNRVPRAKRRGSRGQALGELALVGILLIVLLVGTGQFGVLYYDTMSIDTAAREAARVASENPGGSGVFSSPNSPTSPGSHTCTGTGDTNVGCQAAYNSTHSGTLGGLINTANLSVTLQGSTFSGSSPAVCPEGGGTSDGVVAATVSYNAPVFVPIVEQLIATPGHTYRTVTATVSLRVDPCNSTLGR